MAFTVHIKEEERDLPVSKKRIEEISELAFEITGCEEGDISLVVCNDRFITELNNKYRKKNEPTDVLSFSMREGEGCEIHTSLLGDIIISLDTAKQHAEKLGETVAKEFQTLFIHGLLHLLGFHHNSSKKRDRVDYYTQKILTEVLKDK